MPQPANSIRQNAGQPMPDWRNLGVLLRVILGGMVLALSAALIRANDLWSWLPVFIESSAWVVPLLFVNLILLALFRNLLWRCSTGVAQFLVLFMVAVTTLLLWDAGRFLGLVTGGGSTLVRFVMLVVGGASIILIYFDLRAKAFSPRVAEANLQALNARIRPHFLFNSLNTVISLIRSDPRRAETALEELADLFRSLLRDTRELVLLSDEISLGRQYLELEKLRLGERLQVVWEIHEVPEDILVPPLMLQPLLENAVLHGIEHAAQPGIIRVVLRLTGEGLQLLVTNPMFPHEASGKKPAGNHMALRNIRERLSLYYDLEARLSHGPVGEDYQVRIELPCKHFRPRTS